MDDEELLTDTDELGVKILALVREGLLDSFKCSKCSDEMAKIRNCAGDADNDTPVYINPIVGEFYACPLTFISDAVMGFLDKYDYQEKYPSTADAYNDVNPRFWNAVKLYEQTKYEIEEEKTNDKGNGDTDVAMSKMNSLFNKQG